MITTPADAPNSRTGRYDVADAAEQAGLTVLRIPVDDRGTVSVAALVEAAGPGVAYRCAGGALAAAIATGASIRLVGATAAWFARLPVEVTGRALTLGGVGDARVLLAHGPALIKLAESKYRSLPARRYISVSDFDAALARVHAPQTLQLLGTSG